MHIKAYISIVGITLLSFINPNPINAQSVEYDAKQRRQTEFRVIIDQTAAEVRVFEIDGTHKNLMRTMPAGVAKNPEWRIRSGTYEVTLLAQRYVFTGWGKPRPRAGCGVQITPADGNPAIPNHPSRVILFHTEPSSSVHASHNACRMKNGTFVTSLSSAKKADLFQGRGKRSHGCIRLSAADARYLFQLALKYNLIVTVK